MKRNGVELSARATISRTGHHGGSSRLTYLRSGGEGVLYYRCNLLLKLKSEPHHLGVNAGRPSPIYSQSVHDKIW